MMYKDKEKQKEANRLASQRRRNKAKGMTQGIANQGMTTTAKVIPKPKDIIDVLHNRIMANPKVRLASTKCAAILQSRERSRQSSAKPGDADYPEQTGLNTCNICGVKLKYDVLDVCYPCVVPPKQHEVAPEQEIMA